MSWQQQEFLNANDSNTSADPSYLHYVQKPIELYVFIDPFSHDCWSLQAYLKKLTMEYGRFFTLRTIVGGTFCVSKDSNQDGSYNNQVSCIFEKNKFLPPNQPFTTYFAIKAAELQGKKAGKKFLRKIQEKIFLSKMNIVSENVLIECAFEADLDMQEFERDFFSSSSRNAYHCDRRLIREMDVKAMPTIVFFNQTADTHGIKVSGLYPYEVYELVLSEILTYRPIPSVKLSLEEFIRRQAIVGTQEIAIIYEWTSTRAEKEMKKLQFKQKVKRFTNDYGTFWKYTHELT